MLDISIFTPTHDTRFLLETYNSIKDQDFYEWVLYPNGGAVIPDEIQQDSRVKIILDALVSPLETDGKPNIGSLKKIACACCKCPNLLELDHDDILVDGAIEKVRNAFEDPNVVLVYSNTADFIDGTSNPKFYGGATSDNLYDHLYNWQYREFVYSGTTYYEAVAPPASPYHSSIILFQPNHLRAFRRSAYEAVCGYDDTLPVCDDQDLICRLYMHGDFYHIDECLYLYRIYGDNSWLQRNEDIQTRMVELQKKYIHDMIISWATRKSYPMLDLGGRFNSPKGFIAVDKNGGDVECDLNKRWPFEDSSAGVIRAFDIAEHLDSPIHFFKECYRVLMPGGYLLFNTPSTDGRGAFQDPTHKSFYNENSILYYTNQNFSKYIDTPVRFHAITNETIYPNEWCEEMKIPYVSSIMLSLKDYRPHGKIYI